MGISWERGRPARILVLMVVAELPRGFAGSHYVGSNRNGQAEGEPGRRCRSIQVEELPEGVPVIVRAGRPRSQEAFDHTLDREHGLHLATVSGKELGAGLEITPPLRGSRREGGARSRAGGGQTRRPVSNFQRHGQPPVDGAGMAPASQSR